MSARFSSNITKRLFFYLSKFEEEKTIFVSHNLLSLIAAWFAESYYV